MIFHASLLPSRLKILRMLHKSSGRMSREQLKKSLKILDEAQLSADISYLQSGEYIDYDYPNGANSAPNPYNIHITAMGENALKPIWYRQEQLAINFLGIIGSLLVGALTAWFSSYLTNQSNLELLEPNIEISAGVSNELGLIPIENDQINLKLTNVGPSKIKNIEVYIDVFHAKADLSGIRPEYLQAPPIYLIPKMNLNESIPAPFGRDRLVWKNVFENERRFYLDAKNKENLLFLRIHVRYRRAKDGKLFTQNKIYYATRTTLVDWRVPRNTEEFLENRTH
jgi:hypothetical protein